MSKILKLTLGTGETQEVTLETTSVVMVRTRTNPSPGEVVDVEAAFTDVVAAKIVDAADPAPAVLAEAPPEATANDGEDHTLTSPTAAIEHARSLPIEDAAVHVAAALARFPGDSDLLAAQSEIESIIGGGDGWDGQERRVADGPRRVDTTTVPETEKRTGLADRRTAEA